MTLFVALAALAVIEALGITVVVALCKAAARRPPQPLAKGSGPRRRPGGGWTN